MEGVTATTATANTGEVATNTPCIEVLGPYYLLCVARYQSVDRLHNALREGRLPNTDTLKRDMVMSRLHLAVAVHRAVQAGGSAGIDSSLIVHGGGGPHATSSTSSGTPVAAVPSHNRDRLGSGIIPAIAASKNLGDAYRRWSLDSSYLAQGRPILIVVLSRRGGVTTTTTERDATAVAEVEEALSLIDSPICESPSSLRPHHHHHHDDGRGTHHGGRTRQHHPHSSTIYPGLNVPDIVAAYNVQHDLCPVPGGTKGGNLSSRQRSSSNSGKLTASGGVVAPVDVDALLGLSPSDNAACPSDRDAALQRLEGLVVNRISTFDV